MYYVYEWFIIETGEIIYVGKGTGRRYKVRKHNRLFDKMISENECSSRIVKEFETEQDAFHYENLRVSELKEIGQCVCNIYNGGYGGTTSWWTDERREEYSLKNAMYSQEQRQRMSKNNPMKNKNVATIVGEKHRRAVVIGDREYSGVLLVMEKYNVAYETVRNWCKKGITPFGEKCRYKDEAQKEFGGGRFNKGGCKPVIYNGKRYECAADVAREIGVSDSTVPRWAQKGFTPDGIPCHYENDHRTFTFKPYISGIDNRKSVYVNGTRYVSIRAAEDALGLKRGYLAPYFKGTRRNKKYICEYDNQQPSRGNSDKSTPEGSTTNG